MQSACHLSRPKVTLGLKRSTLHRVLNNTRKCRREPWAGNPQSMVYTNLQPPDGTARRSPDGWWSLTPPSHPYPIKRGGYFLLPTPTVTNCFHFQKWSTLCCPDFPLSTPPPSEESSRLLLPATSRNTAIILQR